MANIEVSLQMPTKTGSAIVASTVVQEALREHPDVKVQSVGVKKEKGGAFQDFGATAVAILGTAAAVAAVKGLFAVIRAAIMEAHRTSRERQKQEHERRKLVLVIQARQEEIDLDRTKAELEAQVSRLEQEALSLAE